MSKQKTNALSIFIDIRCSTDIEDKKYIYTSFYNKFRNLKKGKINNQELNHLNLDYKAFVGDSVFLNYKCGALSDEILILLQEIGKIVLKLEEKLDVGIGVGVAYGEYENVEIGFDGENKMAPVGIYIDYASKASSIARKNSELHFAIKTEHINDENGEIEDIEKNLDLLNFLMKYESFYHKGTTSWKYVRFDFDFE